METHTSHSMFDRRPIARYRAPAVKWFKEWVPQDLVATGGKTLVLKWVNEDTLNAMKEKSKEPEVLEPEPEPTTEVLILCRYEGCGKTFMDAVSLKKHSHIHGEKQHVCHFENCGKKFLDSSKLKRHFLSHTGERDFVCPHEGCGKAFSLDFNLKSHMKTHAHENYHNCPYPDCGKRYAHEYKLKNHIASHHEKNMMEATAMVKYVAPPEKPMKTPKSSTTGPVSSERPYGCPYEGCEKAYIHEYKLNLHLKREHPGHFIDENAKANQPNNENDVDEGSDDHAAAFTGKRGGNGNGNGGGRVNKQSRPKPNLKLPPSKVHHRKTSTVSPVNLNVVKKHRPLKEEIYEEEEDSEETEEEHEKNIGDGWRYGENNDDDDEETEYED